MNYFNNGAGAMNMMGGSIYGRMNPIKVTNPLTQEELNTLLNNGNNAILRVTKEDVARAICTHKDPKTGQTSGIVQPDGSIKCYICGEQFNLVENPEMVDTITREFLNILQTIKSLYVDIPENVARQFFQIIPLVKQAPALYKVATNHFNQYDQGFGGVNNINSNPFAAYTAMAGGMNMGMPMGGMGMGSMAMDPTMMMNGMAGMAPMGANPMMMAGMQGMQAGMPGVPGMGPMVTDPNGMMVNMVGNQMNNQGYLDPNAGMAAGTFNPFFATGAGFAAGVNPSAAAMQQGQQGVQMGTGTMGAPAGVTIPGGASLPSIPNGVSNEVTVNQSMSV